MKIVLMAVVFVVMAYLSFYFVWKVSDEALKGILGTTYSELSSMKKECELVIPRNQECVASIVFLPTAIEE